MSLVGGSGEQLCPHASRAALLQVCVRLHVSVSGYLRAGAGGTVSPCACVSALLSVSLVCVFVEAWVSKSLCVSEPCGWRAELLQVATRKSKQVRVGGCEVGRAWMKASEYTAESQRQRGQRGAEQAEGVQVGRRRKTEGVSEIGVLFVSLPALTGPDCACST